MRFSKYMPDVRTAVFYGGTPIQKDVELIKNPTTCPHIVVATPGRLNGLVRDKYLRVNNVKNFVLDECDKMLEAVGMCPYPRLTTRVLTFRYEKGYSRCLQGDAAS